MLKATYIQQCGHNLSERSKVQEELQVPRISLQRKKYLRSQLNRLNKEKEFFQSIRGEFILTPKDRLVL